MAIEYNKIKWENNVTQLNATNMNHIEDGIEAACSHIDATPISKGTGTNSLVGNDLTTNSAISENVTSFGTGNIGGLKGYYWSAINLYAKTITLASAHTGDSPVTCGYAVGDVISIVNGAKYNNCSKITAISSNVVTVDSFPFTKIESETPAFDNYCIYCNAKPAIGTADLGKNAVVFGDNNKSGNRSSFIAGRDNAGVGQYGFAAGRGNTVAYASFAAGRNNNISHDYSCGIGWNNTSGGQVSTLIGYGNTGRGNYNFLIGASNDTSKNVTEQISIGFANHSEAKTTFSIGKNNKHYLPNGIIIGTNNIGQGGVCLGDNNTVRENQYTVGKNNRESFKVANVYRFGESLLPNSNQTIVGRYNKQVSSTASFIVGVGTSDTDRKNGMWVTSNGNIVAGGSKLILNGNGTQVVLTAEQLTQLLEFNNSTIKNFPVKLTLTNCNVDIKNPIVIKGTKTVLIVSVNNYLYGFNTPTVSGADFY